MFKDRFFMKKMIAALLVFCIVRDSFSSSDLHREGRFDQGRNIVDMLAANTDSHFDIIRKVHDEIARELFWNPRDLDLCFACG